MFVRELLSGEEVNVGGFPCRDAADDFFVCNGIEYLSVIRKPRFAALKNIYNNICV